MVTLERSRWSWLSDTSVDLTMHRTTNKYDNRNMKSNIHTRRTFLAGIGAGATIALAGCAADTEDMSGGTTPTPTETESESNGGQATGTPTETDTETESETESPTETESGEASVSIENEELKVEESSYSTDAYVLAEVVNSSEAVAGQLSLEARFYDADGNFLDNGSASLARLKGGETWQARVSFLGDAENVDGFELEGEYNSMPSFPGEDVVKLLDSELSTSADNPVITGRLENVSDDAVDYVEVHGLFYADETTIIDAEWTNQTDIPDGETWKFELELWDMYDLKSEITGHDVVVSEVSVY